MKIQMVAKSDVGKVRETNEDFCGIFKEDKLALVCDGMGGHKAGSHASRLAVSTIRYAFSYIDGGVHNQIANDVLDNEADEANAEKLVSSIRLANRYIFNRACKEPDYRGMGTTVSAITFNADGLACIAHVGDSRVYRYRSNKLEQLTEDHSWLNELIQDREIKKEDARQFEKKNVITRALGLGATVKIDMQLEPVDEGDVFLLCSDGLTDQLSDDDIQQILHLNQDNLQRCASHLISSANIAGGTDNISVVLVQIDEVSEASNGHTPKSFSFKDESAAVSILENRILQREFNNKGKFSTITYRASELWERKAVRIASVLVILSGIGFGLLQMFSGSNDELSATSIQLEPGDIDVTKQIANNRFRKAMSGHGSESLNNPDGQHSSQGISGDSSTASELLRTKPLTQSNRRIGQIFLLGIEEINNYRDTYIYLDNRLAGRTTEFIESGIRVRPGMYQIAIKDANKNTIYQYASRIRVAAGDIKAIEIRPN